MTSNRSFTLAATILLVMGLVLGACTRSAPTVLPDVTTAAPGIPTTGIGQDATMAAVGTSIAAQMTATAGSLQGPIGVTPIAPTAAPLGSPTVPPLVTATPVVASPLPPAAGCPSPYTVVQGDWIYKIARQCSVEPSAIIAANPGINPERIVPGQQLVMPPAGATAVPPATAQACIGSYVVRTGDNLFRIAYNCGLTTEQLAAFNAIPFPYTIYVGQTIRYP